MLAMDSNAELATGGACVPARGDFVLAIGYKSFYAPPVASYPASFFRLYMAKSLAWSAKCIIFS